MCPTCMWEDDGQDDHDADIVRGGPNSDLSLTQARIIWRGRSSTQSDYVPEEVLSYDEILRRGGANCGDEDFALFRCPSCDRVYRMEYEVDTAYLDGADLSLRASVFDCSFECLSCHRMIPYDEPWIGPKASPKFRVTWRQLARSSWSWVVPQFTSSMT